jgi:CHASE2 domain-containing sensor protein
MDGIIDLLSLLSGGIGPSRGVVDALPPGAFYLIVAFCLFGSFLINNLAQRRSLFHLAVTLSVMFLGAVAGNALLAGVRIPLTNEVVVSGIFALTGMTFTGLALLFLYRKADF